MTVSSAPTQREHTSRDSLQVSRDYTYEEGRGDGWIAFAGTLLLLLGTLNVIDGIAAVSNSSFFVNGTHFIFGSLNTWGWVVMCIGLAELAVGLGVFVRNQLSRWTGIVVLSINSIAQLLMMPAYPFWSLTIFTMDLLAIYGLVAYGRRISSGSRQVPSKDLRGGMFFDSMKRRTFATVVSDEATGPAARCGSARRSSGRCGGAPPRR